MVAMGGRPLLHGRMDEIAELVAAALAAPEAARATGLAAQRRAYRDHTYRARMAALLETVGRSGA